MTNTERQRKFRERNPGYYARIHATRRASAKRGAKQFQEARLAEYQAAVMAERQAAEDALAAKLEPLTTAVQLALPTPPVRLALPAPAVLPVLPALHTLHKIDVAIEIK